MFETQIDQVFKCPCCRGENFDTILKLDTDKRINLFNEYSKKYYQNFLINFTLEKVAVAKCRSCKHLFYKYQPSEAFLEKMYSIHQKNKAKKPVAAKSTKEIRMKKVLNKILKTSKSHSILDYGSGAGLLKEISESLNLNYFAYEPSKDRNEIKGNKKVFTNFNELSNTNIKFDIVYMNQVLEHVKNPLSVMKSIKNLCHSETVVYISTPNFYRSKEKSNFFSCWPYDQAFRHHTIAPFQHLHCFNTSSLLKLMKNSGFKIKLDLKTILNFNLHILRIFLGLVFKRISTTELVFELE